MGEPVQPVPVKLFTGILVSKDQSLERAKSMLESEWGPIDFVSDRYPFKLTDYYESEMGVGVDRLFWSFRDLIDPSRLPDIKLFTNSVEEQLACDGSRKINLDPGYLDFHKMILASVKERAQKIYINAGIYADPTLYYLKGQFHAYDWSLPDFKPDTYHPFFHEMRSKYRIGLREFDKSTIRFSGFHQASI